jgi:hypothetical protein
MTMSRPHTPPLEASFLNILERARPNVLVIGDAACTTDALEHMRPYLVMPLASWLPSESITLPATRFRTLVVQDVDQLVATQQADLLAQLDETAADVQLVSLARAPLFPAVVKGAFLEDLYYRLNVVVLDCANAQDGVNE